MSTTPSTRLRILEFVEETDYVVSPEELSQEAALLVHNAFSQQISIEFPSPINGHSYVLRSRGLIGQIPLDQMHLLVIQPKVPVSNVFLMLEYAYKLRSFEFLTGLVSTDSLEDLYERLVFFLAKNILNRARKGLYRGYVLQEENLPYLRGRLLLRSRTISKGIGTSNLPCEFEDHTADVWDNQILIWTLHRLTRTSLKRREVRQAVREAYRVLAGSVSITHVNAKECVQRLYHRLNDDYRPLHALCRFFLENMGPGIKTGDHEMIPFVLSMPMLFQSFVFEWLKVHLPEKYVIESQARVYLSEDRTFYFDIDLLLRERETDQILAVLDTKYKRASGPSNDDIAQLVAYATSERTDKAILIYPSSQTQFYSVRIGEIEVRALCFELDQDLNQAGRVFIQQLELFLHPN